MEKRNAEGGVAGGQDLYASTYMKYCINPARWPSLRCSELYTQQKTHNLFWPDENSIEQCFAAYIVQGC